MIRGIVRPLGKSLMADMRINEKHVKVLQNENSLRQLLLDAFADANIRIVVDAENVKKIISHDFTDETGVDDDGITIATIFGESHGAVSTWPFRANPDNGKVENYSTICLDIFTCGDVQKPYRAFGYIAAHLEAELMVVRAVDRGEPG